VLTDMAVSQASAVTALHRANPSLDQRALYRGAFAVGRDHFAGTIHTLVLAYVGAALPLILVLRDAHVGAADAINGQIVAEPVIATLVGATALVAAVPITAALAALLVARVPGEALTAAHSHPHERPRLPPVRGRSHVESAAGTLAGRRLSAPGGRRGRVRPRPSPRAAWSARRATDLRTC
jgi:hypothetical protein